MFSEVMTTFNFERLNCWKYARTLVKNIYSVTGQFPESEKFGLVNQLRRAAVSVSSNVAEGAGRQAPKDQKHFYTMAYGSLCEIMNQLIIAFDLEFITEQQLSQFREEITTVAKLLSGMSTATQKRIQS